ncbi:YceI family protein [Crocinitomix sp.]|nr:YceI family protein [Crocinitomix sp.]
MKKTAIFLVLLGLALNVNGQKYLTRTGVIQFFSETDMENIEAINNQASSVINMENGDMAFTILMKAFSFEKALMQEHFNEKYVESEKFPKAKFTGQIQNFSALKLSSSPTEIIIKGKLTIHGVTKDVEVKGTLAQLSNGHVKGISTFTIKLEDYDIKVPSAVASNISDTIEIKVNMDYEKMD